MFRCNTATKSVYSKKDRVLVIGDLHGDYKKTIELFTKLKLIDTNLHWIAQPKNTFVVQLGDQVDGGGRGVGDTEGELKLVNFMEDINQKAMRVGGAVISLIGNHEIMNMIGDFRFASQKDIDEVGGIEIRRKLFKPGGDLFNRLSCTRNVVVKIGSWVFVHAGILPKHVLTHGSAENNVDSKIIGDKWFESVNNLMRLFMQGKKTAYDPEIQNLFLDKNGMIWDRDYGSSQPTCGMWDVTKKLLGVDNIVIGHTVQDNINAKCDNKIWRVDVGISSLFGTNNTQILEILDNGEPLPRNKFKPIRVIN
jgi:hypothetical protein